MASGNAEVPESRDFDDSFDPLYIQVCLWMALSKQALTLPSTPRKVEDTVFCINRLVLVEDSEFFQALFTLPQDMSKPKEGSSKEHPLLIQGVAKDDMTVLLRAMYPRCVVSVAVRPESHKLTHSKGVSWRRKASRTQNGWSCFDCCPFGGLTAVAKPY